ncbi:restriction endonuclease subunit S [Sulfuricurvum sp.]|uniref:restriction endonuclease subunit S n=1 Tax=Sulfuricurvum sp. TaxID=2025608 RepID=UPI00356B53F0
MSKNIPTLRFPEFKDAPEWEEKALGDLLEFKNGINATKEQYGKGYKFINVLDILNNEFITHDKIIGSVNVDEAVMNKYLVEYGDILFQRSSETQEEVGTASVYLDKYSTATFGGFVIRGKKITDYEPVFLNKLLKTNLSRNQITSKSAGSTRYNVGQEVLTSVILPFPSLSEQKKIAECFLSIDDLITAQTAKSQALKEHKKALMQQIFPSEGESVPKLRFSEFKDAPEWEEKILDEVVNYENGKAHENDISENGKYIVVNSKFISTEGDIRKYTNKAFCPANVDDILMVLSDVPNGRAIAKCYLVESDDLYTVNQRICRLSSKKAVSKFLFYILDRNKYFLSFDDGVKQTNLRKEDVLNCPILIPSNQEEQQKIADCLSSFDDLITAQTAKVQALKEHKKALMQQLFPSVKES